MDAASRFSQMEDDAATLNDFDFTEEELALIDDILKK